MVKILHDRGAKKETAVLFFFDFSILITTFLIGRETFLTGIFLTSIFTMLFFLHVRNRKREIAEIVEIVDRILYSDEFLLSEDLSEGEFAVLKSQLHKMTTKIRDGADKLAKEKLFLQDAIADISHQLKTPLTSINMILDFLEDEDISERERREYIVRLKRHITHFEWLVSSLLKISKFDAGTIKFKKDKVSVSEVVTKAVSEILLPLEIKGQLIDFRSRGNESFIGDSDWTAEAVSNILKNCMEHTPQGGHITIGAKENVIYTEIEITDNGSGISAEDLPHIFERFYRGKNSEASSVGIGLAMSRMIVSGQNGTIKAGNRVGGGVYFNIKFYREDVDENA